MHLGTGKFKAMEVTKPYKFIRSGATDVTKPFKSIGFGAHGPGTDNYNKDHAAIVDPCGDAALLRLVWGISTPNRAFAQRSKISSVPESGLKSSIWGVQTAPCLPKTPGKGWRASPPRGLGAPKIGDFRPESYI